jgi:hypothetical protein
MQRYKNYPIAKKKKKTPGVPYIWQQDQIQKANKRGK